MTGLFQKLRFLLPANLCWLNLFRSCASQRYFAVFTSESANENSKFSIIQMQGGKWVFRIWISRPSGDFRFQIFDFWPACPVFNSIWTFNTAIKLFFVMIQSGPTWHNNFPPENFPTDTVFHWFEVSLAFCHAIWNCYVSNVGNLALSFCFNQVLPYSHRKWGF